MNPINWETAAAVCAVAAFVGGVLFGILRSQLSHFFLTRQEHVELEARLETVEQKLLHLPTTDDFRTILDRLAEGKGRFETMAAQMDGTRSSVSRVEHQLDLVYRFILEKEKQP